MPRTQANFVALTFAYLILSYLRANSIELAQGFTLTICDERRPCASSIGLARHVTSRDRVGRVGHSTRILRSSHPVGLGNLPDSRVRVERVNSIELKPNLTITLFL